MAGKIKTAVSLILAVLILWLAVSAVKGMNEAQRAEALDSTKNAVVRAVVSCYALEGQYPESLEYLEKGYGLILNTDKYIYHYMPQGANLMPEIAVFAK